MPSPLVSQHRYKQKGKNCQAHYGNQRHKQAANGEFFEAFALLAVCAFSEFLVKHGGLAPLRGAESLRTGSRRGDEQDDHRQHGDSCYDKQPNEDAPEGDGRVLARVVALHSLMWVRLIQLDVIPI